MYDFRNKLVYTVKANVILSSSYFFLLLVREGLLIVERRASYSGKPPKVYSEAGKKYYIKYVNLSDYFFLSLYFLL